MGAWGSGGAEPRLRMLVGLRSPLSADSVLKCFAASKCNEYSPLGSCIEKQLVPFIHTLIFLV